MSKINIYRFKRDGKNLNPEDLINKNYLEKLKEHEIYQKRESGDKEDLKYNIDENNFLIPKSYLYIKNTEDNYILFHKKERKINNRKYTIISGNYIYPKPPWSSLAEESIFQKHKLSPFCLIFLYPVPQKGKPKDLVWVISYGTGNLVLNTKSATPDFGLNIAKKSTDPSNITAIRSATITRKPRVNNSTISGGGSLAEHGYDKLSTIPAKVTGRAKNSYRKLGKNLFSGGINLLSSIKESLSINSIDEYINAILEYCEYCEEIYKEDNNAEKNTFSRFIDISSEDQQKLNKGIFDSIRKGQSSEYELYMSYPEDFDYMEELYSLEARVYPECKKHKNKNESIYLDILGAGKYKNLDLEEIINFLKGLNNNCPNCTLENSKIMITFNNQNEKFWNLTDWISGTFSYSDLDDTEDKNQKEYYYIYNGKWLKAENVLVNEMEEYFDKLHNKQHKEYRIFNEILLKTARCAVKENLTPAGNICEEYFNIILTENLQNESSEIHDKGNVVLLDMGNDRTNGIKISSSGNEVIEVSDIYAHKGVYIHVKNQAGVSRNLSHLMTQSYTSTRYIVDDKQDSYKKITDLLKDKHKDLFDQINPSDIKIERVILVLIFKKSIKKNNGSLLTPLKQIPLYQHIKSLESMGVEVCFLAISQQDAIDWYSSDKDREFK